MCLAIPARVVELQDADNAVVELGGVRKTVCVALTPEARIGDYVIVHVGHAIGLIDPEEAARMQQNYLTAVAKAQPFSGETAYLYQGQRRVSRFWGVPYVSENNELLGMLCSSVDISEQDQEFTALAHAEQVHLASRKRRTRLLHDLGEHAKQLPDRKSVV